MIEPPPPPDPDPDEDDEEDPMGMFEYELAGDVVPELLYAAGVCGDGDNEAPLGM